MRGMKKGTDPFPLMRFARPVVWSVVLTALLGVAGTALAQQLEPRAYAPAPAGMSIFGVAAFYSSGDVVLDPSVPIENLQARVRIAAPFYGRTFGLFGRLANVGIIAPFAQADATGDVEGEGRSIDRSGPGDPVFRFAVNLIGSPALTPKEFSTRTRETILGTSLTVVAPLGQYDPAKLINLGANRWAFKPELGLSHPVGPWDLELYAGVWVFTANDNFYGGKVRRQDPLRTTQAHVVYTFLPNLWLSLDYTYYAGGATTVTGQQKRDRQDNSRTGLTLAVPVARQQSMKLSWSRGVSVRVGQDFDALGVSWQYFWF
jgi:hypothetical protein